MKRNNTALIVSSLPSKVMQICITPPLPSSKRKYRYRLYKLTVYLLLLRVRQNGQWMELALGSGLLAHEPGALPKLHRVPTCWQPQLSLVHCPLAIAPTQFHR